MEIDSRSEDRPTGTGNRAAILLVVAAASAVVALGVPGTGVLSPPATSGGAWERTVRMGGAVAAIAGLVALLAQRRRLRSDRRHGPDPTATGLRAAATIMGVLAVLALLTPRLRLEREPGALPTGGMAINPDAPGPAPPPSTRAPITEGYTTEQARDYPLGPVVPPGRDGHLGGGAPSGGSGWSLPPHWKILLFLVLLSAGAVAVLRMLGGGRTPREVELTPPEAPVAPEDAEAGLLASLEDILAAGGDPRRQITAAYHRLLAALTAAGAPRQPQEAPHEHLGRTLAPLGVRPEPMHRLTELYVTAQFSERPVTNRHRAAAVEALEASLAGLRAVAGQASS